jgi:hypothetical protein
MDNLLVHLEEAAAPVCHAEIHTRLGKPLLVSF